jgi:hypothetical protein
MPAANRETRRVLLLVLALSVPACLSAPLERSSPMRVRNQHPAQLTAIHGDPRPARPAAPGGLEADVRLDWTSLWTQPGTGSDEIVLDGEIVRAELDLRMGLGEGIDLEVGIPILHPTSGCLDGFIEGWHDFFGLPDGERNEFPRNRFDVAARRARGNGEFEDAYRLDEDGLHLGDIPVFLAWFPVRRDGTGLALGIRGGIEFPTGDESRGFGNGGFDASLGFVSGWDGRGFSLFAWGNHAWVARPETARDAGLDTPNIESLGVGGEIALLDRLSALVQVEWERSLLRELDDSHAGKDQAMVAFGGRYRFARSASIEFGVMEDLVAEVSPDITLHLALSLAF